MLKTPLGRLRLVGIVEGLSFLVLLGIAMPLKYFADMPLAVTWAGSVHGFLFVVYIIAIAYTLAVRQLSMGKALLAVIAAFVPFGPFILDVWLRKDNIMTISK